MKTISKSSKHGGARPGAGRPKGSVKGRKSAVKSVSLTLEAWERIERQRGSVPRGRWIERQIFG